MPARYRNLASRRGRPATRRASGPSTCPRRCGLTATGFTLVRPLTAAPDLDGWAIVERRLEDLHSLRGRVWLVIDDLHELRAAHALRQLELLVMRARRSCISRHLEQARALARRAGRP